MEKKLVEKWKDRKNTEERLVELWKDMEIMEEIQVEIVKRYGKGWRKVGWIVKWSGKYERK
jgi:hypothetical protein